MDKVAGTLDCSWPVQFQLCYYTDTIETDIDYVARTYWVLISRDCD